MQIIYLPRGIWSPTDLGPSPVGSRRWRVEARSRSTFAGLRCFGDVGWRYPDLSGGAIECGRPAPAGSARSFAAPSARRALSASGRPDRRVGEDWRTPPLASRCFQTPLHGIKPNRRRACAELTSCQYVRGDRRGMLMHRDEQTGFAELTFQRESRNKVGQRVLRRATFNNHIRVRWRTSPGKSLLQLSRTRPDLLCRQEVSTHSREATLPARTQRIRASRTHRFLTSTPLIGCGQLTPGSRGGW